MLAPSIAILSIIIVVPLLYLFYNSLFDYQLFKPYARSFIGMRNFIRAFTEDDRFMNSVKVTLYLIAMAVALQTLVALLLAEVLQSVRKLKETLRTVLIIPMVIPPFVAGIVWRMMLHPNAGLINYFLSFLGIDHPWLADPKTALFAIVVIDTWQWTPFLLLIFLAGYAAIPAGLYEAAEVDGAGRWGKFMHITLPLLLKVILVGIIFRTVGILQTFSTLFVTTEGGPGYATEILNYYSYVTAFNPQ